MTDYQETKDLIEKNQKTIDLINKKELELDNESDNIKEKVKGIMRTPVTKDSYIISKEELIEKYIYKVDKNNIEYKSIIKPIYLIYAF